MRRKIFLVLPILFLTLFLFDLPMVFSIPSFEVLAVDGFVDEVHELPTYGSSPWLGSNDSDTSYLWSAQKTVRETRYFTFEDTSFVSVVSCKLGISQRVLDEGNSIYTELSLWNGTGYKFLIWQQTFTTFYFNVTCDTFSALENNVTKINNARLRLRVYVDAQGYQGRITCAWLEVSGFGGLPSYPVTVVEGATRMSALTFADASFDNGKLWVFHVDRTTSPYRVRYMYSDDEGLNWVEPSNSLTVTGGLGVYGDYYSVYWDANISYVYLVWCSPSTWRAEYVRLRRGTPNGDNTDFVWESIKTVEYSSGYHNNQPNVITDSHNEELFVAFGRMSVSNSGLRVRRSVDNGSTWSTFFYEPLGTISVSPEFIKLPDNNILWIYNYANYLTSRFYNITTKTLSNRVYIYQTGDTNSEYCHKAEYFNGTVHIIYRKSPATGNLVTKLYNEASNSWYNERIVATSLTDLDQGVGLIGNSTIEYAFYGDTGADRIYFCNRTSSSMNFSSSQILYGSEFGLFGWEFSCSISEKSENPEFLLMVWRNDLSNDQIRFAKFVLIGVPIIITVSSLPEIHANFTINAIEYLTPQTFEVDPGSFVFEVSDAVGAYDFNYWLVNGIVHLENPLSLSLVADTMVIIYWKYRLSETGDWISEHSLLFLFLAGCVICMISPFMGISSLKAHNFEDGILWFILWFPIGIAFIIAYLGAG